MDEKELTPPPQEKDFIDSPDAMVWAEAFCAYYEHLARMGRKNIIEPGWLVGWFANAMGAAERNSTEQHRVSVESGENEKVVIVNIYRGPNGE